MRVIKPKCAVTLGKHSTSHIFSKVRLPFRTITRERGAVHEINLLNVRMMVFPTLHPAAALYSAKYKQQLMNDFRVLGEELLKRRIVHR